MKKKPILEGYTLEEAHRIVRAKIAASVISLRARIRAERKKQTLTMKHQHHAATH